jgi:hypothetical protein
VQKKQELLKKDKMNKCIDCNKEVSAKIVKRCWDCYVKQSKNPKNNGFYNKKHTKETKEIMRQKAIGRIGFWKNKKRPNLIKPKIEKNINAYWTGKSNKNIIAKHHIDGNKYNNNDSNFLKIKQGLHRSLHWNHYYYIYFHLYDVLL